MVSNVFALGTFSYVTFFKKDPSSASTRHSEDVLSDLGRTGGDIASSPLEAAAIRDYGTPELRCAVVSPVPSPESGAAPPSNDPWRLKDCEIEA